jgi:hypothetical protein
MADLGEKVTFQVAHFIETVSTSLSCVTAAVYPNRSAVHHPSSDVGRERTRPLIIYTLTGMTLCLSTSVFALQPSLARSSRPASCSSQLVPVHLRVRAVSLVRGYFV